MVLYVFMVLQVYDITCRYGSTMQRLNDATSMTFQQLLGDLEVTLDHLYAAFQ